MYLIFWVMLCIVIMTAAHVVIPFYINKYYNSNSIQIGEALGGQIGKQVSYKRVLLGLLGVSTSVMIGIIVHTYIKNNKVQPQLLVSVFSFNILLTSFVLEEDVLRFIKIAITDQFKLLSARSLT